MGAASCCNQVHKEQLVRSKEYIVPPKGICLQGKPSGELTIPSIKVFADEIRSWLPIRAVLLFVKRSMPSLQRGKEIGDFIGKFSGPARQP